MIFVGFVFWNRLTSSLVQAFSGVHVTSVDGTDDCLVGRPDPFAPRLHCGPLPKSMHLLITLNGAFSLL